MLPALLIIIGYLMGSFSSAVIVCKAFGLPDPRQEGSGNPGATNVLRMGGKFPAALVFLVDALKGLIPVLIGHWLELTPFWLGMFGFAAFLGHLYPVFFGFKGGKGVATAFGVVLGLSLPLSGLVFMVWLVIVVITRYVSLASMAAAITAPVIAFGLGSKTLFLPLLLMASLTVWRHHSNIKKIIAGTESKLGKK